MTRKQFTLMVAVVICGSAVIWAGYGDTDDILYHRLDSIGMSADSIDMVMALPRGVMLDWETGSGGRTYLVIDNAVAAAAIITVDTVLFNYNRLRRKK